MILLQLTIDNVGDVFDVFLFISTHISLFLFFQVMQNVSGIFEQKILRSDNPSLSYKR